MSSKLIPNSFILLWGEAIPDVDLRVHITRHPIAGLTILNRRRGKTDTKAFCHDLLTYMDIKAYEEEYTHEADISYNCLLVGLYLNFKDNYITSWVREG